VAALGVDDRRDRQQDRRDHAPDREQPERRGAGFAFHHEVANADRGAGGLRGEEGVGFGGHVRWLALRWSRSGILVICRLRNRYPRQL
jgi:hypothetical protein